MQTNLWGTPAQARSTIDWLDWVDWMVAEYGAAPTTADEMHRAVRHMTKLGVDWAAFQRGPDEARNAVRGFLALKTRSGHRHAVQKYQRALNIVACYLARQDERFKLVKWDLMKVAKGRLDPYTDAEMHALHRYAHRDRFVEARRRAMLWLAEHTGLRRSELQRLHISDLDADRCAILVRQPAKDGAPRWVPVHADAWSPRRALTAWLAIHPRTTPSLWCSKAGTPLNANMMSREFWDIRVATGVKLNFNRFRHTRATDLLERGVRLDTIQALYGHASPKSTLHYARRSLGAVEREMERCGVPGFKARSRRVVRDGVAGGEQHKPTAGEHPEGENARYGEPKMPGRHVVAELQEVDPVVEEAHAR